jgi:glycosyltransferase involved in cell wall biosynthesis
MTPEFTIVIPVYNEAAILEAAITDLRARLLARTPLPAFEILIAENGSRDGTADLAQGLAARFPEVRAFSSSEPNYGAALRQGILEARGTYVLCDEIDLCDSRFHDTALALLRQGEVDLVVGSKAMPGAADHRPFVRRLATRTINGLLRVALGFHGTDTHGLKAFRREALLPVVHACVVGKDLFASELVIRAERQGIRGVEVPVTIEEKRAPSVNLGKRIPRVLSDLARLVYVIRIQGR